MAQSKYHHARAVDIEWIKEFGLELRRRNIKVPVSFSMTMQRRSLKTTITECPDDPRMLSIGDMICDLAKALDEVEAVIQAITGKNYNSEEPLYDVTNSILEKAVLMHGHGNSWFALHPQTRTENEARYRAYLGDVFAKYSKPKKPFPA